MINVLLFGNSVKSPSLNPASELKSTSLSCPPKDVLSNFIEPKFTTASPSLGTGHSKGKVSI